MSPTPPPPKADRGTRQRLLEAAAHVLAARGLAPSLLDQAASLAGCPADRARVFFRRDEEVVLALYTRLATDLEARVPDFPPGAVAERFHAAMTAKLALAEGYRDALAALGAAVLDPRHELGALGPQTEIIRDRVRGVFAAVVEGATDRPPGPTDSLVRALYAAHLALLLVWSQDRTPGSRAAHAALDLVRDLLSFLTPLLALPQAASAAGRLDAVLAPLLAPPEHPALAGKAEAVLRRLFRHRRLLPGAGACATEPCGQCLALHLGRVRYFLRSGHPLHLVLPAFPAKSPSRRKTLGPLPDRAEELALAHLQHVCDELRVLHPPGARVTICSDGHVFGDLVGVGDADVTAYGEQLRAMIGRLGCTALDTFGMADLYEGADFPAMREHLVREYALPAEEVEARAHRSEHAAALVNGIHRFLFEEQLDLRPGVSRTRLRNECRPLAYAVVRRSDAWGRLLADCFPTALRLSIHPQHPHADKIGILLGPADDAWLTPWHGAAVCGAGGWKLMRRDEAESLGARAVECDGRPQWLELPDPPAGEDP
jgi:pyoverdine/dityrosine biosynthesis protein Dit1